MQKISHVIQPIYSPAGQIMFAEVLARFPGRDTQEAVIEAERTGEIIEIDIAGFEHAKRLPLNASINVSGRTVSEGLRGIARHIRPGMVVEITETYPANLKHLKTLAFEIHARGASVAIDDVGCGAFEDLDWVGRVVQEIHPRWVKCSIGSSDDVIDFVIASKKSIVAERLETSVDVQKAIDIGAKGLQGWFFNNPQGSAWLHERRAESVSARINHISAAMALQ